MKRYRVRRTSKNYRDYLDHSKKTENLSELQKEIATLTFQRNRRSSFSRRQAIQAKIDRLMKRLKEEKDESPTG